MSKQYPGGIINKTPIAPTSFSAPGIWTLNQQAAAQATNSWPFIRDPQFNYVTMLLHADGSAGPAANGMGAGASPTQTPFTFDASTNNFNVTINGDTKPNNLTPYQGNGYYSNYFDGSGDYLTAGSSISLSGDFTVEGWVYRATASGNGNYLLGLGNDTFSTGATFFVDTSGYLRIYTSQAHLLGGTSASVPLNAWTHIAFVRSSNTVRAYLNGVQVDSASWSATISGTAYINAELNGNPTATVYAGSAGYLSNVRIGTTAVYTTAFTPSTTPLNAITGTQLLTCQSNRFIDNSTNSYTITKIGDTAVAPTQPFTLPSSVSTYGSAYFDGASDYLTLSANSAFAFGTGDFTVECWINTTTTSSDTFYRRIYMTDGPTGNVSGNFQIALVPTTGYVNLWDGTLDLIGTSNVCNGAWNHIAATRSGTTLRLFVNGVQQASTTYSVSVSPNSGSPRPYIGTFDGSQGDYSGYITDLRVVKGTAVYTTTFVPPTTPLTAISGTSLLTAQFNGGANNNGFKDASQFNFPITRVGNTTQGTFTPYGNLWSNYLGSGNSFTLAGQSAFALGTGDYTIECWFYKLSSAGSIIVDFRPSSTNGLYPILSVSGGAVVFDLNGTRITSSAVSLNTWNHMALVRASGVTKMYINGVQSGVSYTDANNYLVGASRPAIGVNGFTPQDYFDGYISNFRIVKGTAVYTNTFTPSITPLTAIPNTSLLTCADNRFIDDSTNAFTLTVGGSPSVQRFSPFDPAIAYNANSTGGSAYFDGTGDYLTTPTGQVPLTLGTSDFTIEMWVYPTTQIRGNPALFTSDPGAGLANAIMIQFAGTTGQTTLWVNNVNLTASSTTNFIRLNQWNHIAICRSGGSIYSFYINGVAVNNVATNATSLTTSSWYLGYWTVADNAFTGYITNARIIKGTALYIGAFTPNTAPLTAVTGTSLLLNATNAGIFDNAMMNNLETVGNAQVSTTVKKYGNASMYFDGTGDWLVGPRSWSIATSENFTIEGWFYLTAAQANYRMIVSDGTKYFTINSAGLEIQFGGTAGTIANATYSFSQNTWYHIAVVRSSNSVVIYINGTALTMTQGTQSGSFLDTGSLIYVSRYTSGSDYPWVGYIDDLRITRGVARYVANFTPPDQAFPNG